MEFEIEQQKLSNLKYRKKIIVKQMKRASVTWVNIENFNISIYIWSVRRSREKE